MGKKTVKTLKEIWEESGNDTVENCYPENGALITERRDSAGNIYTEVKLPNIDEKQQSSFLYWEKQRGNSQELQISSLFSSLLEKITHLQFVCNDQELCKVASSIINLVEAAESIYYAHFSESHK